jgi:hypothetical protein
VLGRFWLSCRLAVPCRTRLPCLLACLTDRCMHCSTVCPPTTQVDQMRDRWESLASALQVRRGVGVVVDGEVRTGAAHEVAISLHWPVSACSLVAGSCRVARAQEKCEKIALRRQEEDTALDLIALHLSTDSPIRDLMRRVSAVGGGSGSGSSSSSSNSSSSLLSPATVTLLRITSHVELQRVEQAVQKRRAQEDDELEWERERCAAAKDAWQRADAFHRQSLDLFATGQGLS